ncbi:MAG: hypothetical protein ACK5Z5_05325 [Neisseriaceae bacterium]
MMQTILINLPHKLLILLFFALTYIPVLYFGIYSTLDRILIGDAAKSFTFIWSIFFLTLINIIYSIILATGSKKASITKFIIRLNLEYGKIFTGLFLTATVFVIQAIVVEHKIIISSWNEDQSKVIIAFTIIFLSFIIFPMIAAIANYFMVKYFRHALWDQE